MNIHRGYLYVIDFNPRIDTKSGKLRPGVVLQSDLVTEAGYSSTIVIPTTSQVIDNAGFLRLRIPGGICSLEKESDLLVGQMIAVSNLSFRKELGRLPLSLFEELVQRVKIFLDF